MVAALNLAQLTKVALHKAEEMAPSRHHQTYCGLACVGPFKNRLESVDLEGDTVDLTGTDWTYIFS